MTSAARSNSAKRSASGNLSNSSDDEQEDRIPDLRLNLASLSSTGNSELDTSGSLDNPCSPGSSSTSSGPVYIRPPGFRFHAQAVSRPHTKKKKVGLQSKQKLQNAEESFSNKSVPLKSRQIKRDPLPMRMRALPQSFWQQPNRPVGVSPASCHKVLPPLCMKEEIDMIRPVTPPDESKLLEATATCNKSLSSNISKSAKVSDRKIIETANADNLLSKLFEGVEDKSLSSKRSEGTSHTGQSYKTPVPPTVQNIRRGRPMNILKMNKTMMHGVDPYMVDTIADKLFPHLTLEKSAIKSHHISTTGNASLQLITLKEGDKTVTLPSLCIEQNYSQMLSELVPHL